MSINAFLNFEGNCHEALEFYSEVFGEKPLKIQYYKDVKQVEGVVIPEEANNLICYAELSIKGSILMFSDVFPDITVIKGNNISIAITFNDAKELEAIYAKIADSGSIQKQLQETFWSNLYGSVKDKYGVIWQLNLYDK